MRPKKTASGPVGLGPSDAIRASERVSLAIVHATKKRLFRSVGP